MLNMVSKYFSVKTHLSFKVTLTEQLQLWIHTKSSLFWQSAHREIPLGVCICSTDPLQTGETLQWSCHHQPFQQAAAERSFADPRGTWSWSLPWLFCKTAWQRAGCATVAHNSPEKVMSTIVHGVCYLRAENCGRSRRICHLWIGERCLCSDSDLECNTRRRGGRRVSVTGSLQRTRL